MARRSKSKSSPRRWPPHLLARLRPLRDRMAEHDLDALLVNPPHDIRYLTGFGGEDSWAVVLPRSVVILSDSRFAQELQEGCPYARSVMRRKPLSEELEKVVKKSHIRRLGIQAEHVTVAHRRAIIKHIGAKTLTETLGWLTEQRAVKDEREIAAIRKAISTQQNAYRDTLPHIQPGMTEQQVAALLDYNMRLRGADGPSFTTIVASGPNASIPHHLPGASRIRKNTVLLIDFGAQRDGYCGDLTRVVALGQMSRKMSDVYDIVREAQLAAIDAIAPGKDLEEIDGVARKIIKDAGYDKQFGHGLGHGIGLEVHEEPRLGPRAKGQLVPGQVVTVEPGIYLPGVGGVRIEDNVLVTQNGRRKLSTLPTDAESAMI